jgi:hypothetical protein
MLGSNGLDQNLNTDYTEIVNTPLSGTFNFYHTDRRELFNGELGGTELLVHSQSSENIVYEYNSISISSSQDIINNFSRLPINPILNNVTQPRLSNRHLDIDYSYNPIIPVNFNYLTSSLLLNLRTNSFPFLNSTVQDSNYTLYRHITPRYNGSKNISSTYNIYTPGDLSYGSEAAIDYNNVKFAYFNELTSQSLTFPGRTNANIRYLIDSASNIIELTEANRNLFDVQTIFNKTLANISLDDINKPSKQKRINGLKPIYAGGFRYEPILQNYSLSNSDHESLVFNLTQEITTLNPISGSEITASVSPKLQLGDISLDNPITLSPALNQSNSTLSAFLDSTININVIRTAQSSDTIYQRVTGQITINVSVSPSPLLSILYQNKTGSSDTPRWENIPLSPNPPGYWNYTDTLSDYYIGDGASAWNDRIRSVKLPLGVKGEFYRGGELSWDFYGTVIGNGQRVNIPQYNNTFFNEGKVSSFRLSANNVEATLNLTNQQNSFSSTPISFNTGSGGPYIIEEDNGLIITATFLIDGYIELQPGQGVINGSPISLPLKSLTGINGVIRTTFNFTKSTTSPNIRFTQIPTIDLGIGATGEQYILTDAPNQIYTTEVIDNGYNSGSDGISNWYFERGGNDVNKFTQLTASYDLSTLYQTYISNPIGEKNYFIQNLPTSSINDGYQNITEIFNPKLGDLIRFYNHESEQYPFTSEFEREIIKIIPPQGPIGSGSFGTGSYENRLVIEVLGDNIPNAACINKNSLPGEIGKILNFIILSKVPDETNIILIGEKNSGTTSAGMVIPENINTKLKNEAGNIIKNLKSQNLI